MNADIDVAIIGAGSAGIGAARRLSATGYAVQVLEAGSRIGGRAWTETIAGCTIDLGCGWLHSAEHNPWVGIAEASGFTVDRRSSAWRRENAGIGMTMADRQDAQTAFAAWDDLLRSAPPSNDKASEALEPGNRWNNYIDVLSGYINGADLDQLSVQDYVTYDDAATETNWRVAEGYGAMISANMPGNVKVVLCTPVTAIDYSGSCIKLQTPNGTVTAKAAIVTASTNVLASGAIRFFPQIDDRLHAASCLPLGLANKLFIEVDPSGPFAAETYSMGNPHRRGTGGYYVMPLGQKYIECYFGGSGATHIERLGEAGAFAYAYEELAELYGHDVQRFLKPLMVSQWKHAEWIGGSYSHALPGHADARHLLARSVNDKLFFAGEATHKTAFSTAHGAYESGLRAAEEAIMALAV